MTSLSQERRNLSFNVELSATADPKRTLVSMVLSRIFCFWGKLILKKFLSHAAGENFFSLLGGLGAYSPIKF